MAAGGLHTAAIMPVSLCGERHDRDGARSAESRCVAKGGRQNPFPFRPICVMIHSHQNSGHLHIPEIPSPISAMYGRARNLRIHGFSARDTCFDENTIEEGVVLWEMQM